MTVEVTPLGVRCQLACTYCYQHPMRDAGNFGTEQPYDMEKMLAALDQANDRFTVFGGEPLMIPIDDLETLFAFGYDKYGYCNVQTNGALVTAEHLRLFKTYNVHVGFSVDGPDELNDHRWAGSLEKTRAATAKSFATINACMDQDIPFSVIITLHRHNAETVEKRERLKDWIRTIDRLPCRGFRLHTLEVDNALVERHLVLTDDEQIEALLDLHAFAKQLTHIRFDVFTDIANLIVGDDRTATCVWQACDPYTTRAVQGIDGQGNRTNCGRTNKDGVMAMKGERQSFERYLALYHTPQEEGGCQGCRFFAMCKGHCPGEAIDGDWRNRTARCEVWKRLFEVHEAEASASGHPPLSLHNERPEVERRLLEGFAQGETWSLFGILEELDPGAAPGHGDVPHGDHHSDHGDDRYSHDDVSHGDMHTDGGHHDTPHQDSARRVVFETVPKELDASLTV